MHGRSPLAVAARVVPRKEPSRAIATLVDADMELGEHLATLEGRLLREGMYFYRLTEAGRTVEQRFAVVH